MASGYKITVYVDRMVEKWGQSPFIYATQHVS